MFDWQTEDESGWEEQTAVSSNKSSVRRRLWIVPLLIVAGLSAAGLWAYRQVGEQAEVAVTAVEEDILSSHRLLQTAVSNGDVDLLQPLLSGREMDWVAAQIKMVEDGTVNGRYPFGLEWQPDRQQKVVSTDVDPLLESAELQFDQTYSTTLPDGQIEDVTLRQTAVYRRGTTRWLLSPPDDEFWGGWKTLESERLALSYPERDDEIGTKLFADLDALLATWCDSADRIDCDQMGQVTLRLDKQADSLAAFHRVGYAYDHQFPLTLPTPSLVGLPLDDGGYEALFRGYGSLLITAVIADAIAYNCCLHAPLFQTLTDYQLSQLGLRAWVVQPTDHLALWEGEELLSVAGLATFWDMEEWIELDVEDKRFVETAVDFLIQFSPSHSAFEMQWQINNPQANFRQWINEYLLAEAGRQSERASTVIGALDREWRLFANYTQYAQNDQPSPIPLPAQDIQLLCRSNDGGDIQSSLYRYQLDTQTWEEELSKPVLMLMNPLVEDDGILLMEFEFSDEVQSSHFEIWNGGTEQILLQSNDKFRSVTGQIPASGAYLHTFENIESDALIENRSNRQHSLLDLNQCDQSGCAEVNILGMPFWSPSGEQAVFVDTVTLETPNHLADGRIWLLGSPSNSRPLALYRGDAAGQDVVQIETGYAPFWLDETTYGFIQQAGFGDQSLVLASTADDKPIPLLTSADLLAVLPDDVLIRWIDMDYVAVHPTNRNQLFIITHTSDLLGHVISVDLLSGEIEHRIGFGFGFMENHVSGFSPNGRFFITTNKKLSNTSGLDNFITLHDIAQNQNHDFLVGSVDFGIGLIFDWSANGEWLAMVLDDGILQLTAPEQNYSTIIEHEFSGCHAIGWID